MKTKDFNIQGKAAEIFRQYGNSEMGCYKIQLMVEDYAKLAVEEFRNQPSGEGVKSAEEYLDANDPHGWLSEESSMRRVAISALTAQARDYEREILAFKEFYSNAENYQVSADKHLWNTDEGTVTTTELLTQFRNDRSKPKE